MTENELLEALAAELYLEPRQPGDIDNTQLAARLGISARQAENILTGKAAAGELLRVKVRDSNGRPRFVYRAKA